MYYYQDTSVEALRRAMHGVVITFNQVDENGSIQIYQVKETISEDLFDGRKFSQLHAYKVIVDPTQSLAGCNCDDQLYTDDWLCPHIASVLYKDGKNLYGYRPDANSKIVSPLLEIDNLEPPPSYFRKTPPVQPWIGEGSLVQRQVNRIELLKTAEPKTRRRWEDLKSRYNDPAWKAHLTQGHLTTRQEIIAWVGQQEF